jgi:[acyl-carrier-protein] S-malonyltransferase
MFAVVAPGQGAQTPGMLAQWLRNPAAAALVAEWSVAADCDLVHLGTNAGAELIARTEHTQPLLVAQALLALAVLPDATPHPDVVALGHSVGELAAAVFAGVLAPQDAVALAGVRGRAMAAACAAAPTSMAAVVGGDQAVVLHRIDELGLAAANFNGNGQIVAAGERDALAELAAAPPAGAVVKPLAVAGAFHTGYMAPALDEFAAAAEKVDFAEPTGRLVSNLDGAVISSAAEVRRRLIAQVVAPVRWDRCLATLAELAPAVAVALPPAKTQASILKRQVPGVRVVPIANPKDVARFEGSLAHA